jgi:MFS family permease
MGFAFEPSVRGLLALGVAYGVGNGMFLSVDYALACDVLPSFDNAAQSLGVWGVSAFLGSTLGPLAAGPMLSYFGRTESPDHFSSFGYVIVMAMGAIYVSLAAFLLRNVNERAGEKGKERRTGRGSSVQR